MYTSILWDTVHMYIHICICYTYGREDDVYICIYIYYETQRTCIYTYVLYTHMGERIMCIYVYIYIMRHGVRVYTHMYFMHILQRGTRRVTYSPFPRRWDSKWSLKCKTESFGFRFWFKNVCVCVCVYTHMYVCMYLYMCDVRNTLRAMPHCILDDSRMYNECNTNSFGMHNQIIWVSYSESRNYRSRSLFIRKSEKRSKIIVSSSQERAVNDTTSSSLQYMPKVHMCIYTCTVSHNIDIYIYTRLSVSHERIQYICVYTRAPCLIIYIYIYIHVIRSPICV